MQCQKSFDVVEPRFGVSCISWKGFVKPEIMHKSGICRLSAGVENCAKRWGVARRP